VSGARPSQRRQSGVALIIVLWVIVLLSVMAAGHGRNAHMATQLAAHQLDVAQLRRSAEAGVMLAIMELLAQGRPQPWPVDGSAQSVEIQGNLVSIAIRDARGLVDLNSASPLLLASLITITGADAASQAALVDAILDWRDTDDLTRLNGAEAAAYSPETTGWSIHNGPFSTIDELRYVSGMTNEYIDLIAPLVTVYSHRNGVEMEYAPPELVAALTGTEIDVADNTPVAVTGQDSGRRVGGARAGEFHVYVVAPSADTGATATLEAVVRTAPTAAIPYVILNWRTPMRARQRTTEWNENGA
jgi:general secretion pathway protein K